VPCKGDGEPEEDGEGGEVLGVGIYEERFTRDDLGIWGYANLRI